MPNRYDSQIMNDGWRNAVVRITGVLDTGDAVLAPAVSLKDFTNNDTANQRLVGFRMDHIWHAISDGIEVQIAWNAVNPRLVAALAGRGKESFHSVGGIQPTLTDLGYDGAINITTTGWGTMTPPVGQVIQNFTIELEMVKVYRV